MPSTSYYQTSPAELYEHPGPMHQQSVIQPPPLPPTQQSVAQQQTIDTTNPPIQTQQMQSPNTQLVPSIPSAQHIEHYSPYYTPGYSHSGGQCFTPPFMGKQKYGKLYHTHSHSCLCFGCFVFFFVFFKFVFFFRFQKTLIIFVPTKLRFDLFSIFSILYACVCVCLCVWFVQQF